MFVARNGVFLEKEFLSRGVSGITVQLEEIREEPASSELAKALVVEPVVVPEPETAPTLRRSAKLRSVRNVLLLDSDEPANYLEAMVGSDSESWLGAMRSELKSMDENQVWNLVDLPDGARPVECKWVFKKKTDMDGNVSVYKARLVAKGFQQVQGVDYDKTFSPIVKLKSVRIMLAIAAYFDYEIWQMDVKMAFLNGNLTEDVYMIQPEGFVDPANAD